MGLKSEGLSSLLAYGGGMASHLASISFFIVLLYGQELVWHRCFIPSLGVTSAVLPLLRDSGECARDLLCCL